VGAALHCTGGDEPASAVAHVHEEKVAPPPAPTCRARPPAQDASRSF